MKEQINILKDKNDKNAYALTKEIAAASESSPEFYPFLEDFASLLGDEKSYVRTRAFLLCCSQARWDTEGKLKEILPQMLPLLHDPKPTVVRQCLNAIKEVIRFCPELRAAVREELGKMELSQYRDSMIPLIRKDISEVLNLSEEI